MQFPYVKYERNAQFILTKKSHNYTGIRYSIYELNKVVDVDYGSPASKAGIQRGDIIDRINGKRMDHTADEFTAAYRQFITNTLKYRDSGTRFTNANGFPNCMFWDKFKYPQIAKIFETDKYMTAFSYLYFFAPYVNPEGTGANVCILHLRRGTEKLEYIIRPELRSEKTIELN
jgi:PDZ domain-containing protein